MMVSEWTSVMSGAYWSQSQLTVVTWGGQPCNLTSMDIGIRFYTSGGSVNIDHKSGFDCFQLIKMLAKDISRILFLCPSQIRGWIGHWDFVFFGISDQLPTARIVWNICFWNIYDDIHDMYILYTFSQRTWLFAIYQKFEIRYFKNLTILCPSQMIGWNGPWDFVFTGFSQFRLPDQLASTRIIWNICLLHQIQLILIFVW